MHEEMGEGPDHDETSASTPEPEQELKPGQEFQPEQQPELNPQPDQQLQLDPGPKQQPEPEQVSEPNRPHRVRQPPRMFTYNTLGKYCDSVVFKLIPILYLDGAIHLSNHHGCYLHTSTMHKPVMFLWCTHPMMMMMKYA